MLDLISNFAIRYGLGYNLGIGKLRDFGSLGKQTSESHNLCLYLAFFNNIELLKRSSLQEGGIYNTSSLAFTFYDISIKACDPS